MLSCQTLWNRVCYILEAKLFTSRRIYGYQLQQEGLSNKSNDLLSWVGCTLCGRGHNLRRCDYIFHGRSLHASARLVRRGDADFGYRRYPDAIRVDEALGEVAPAWQAGFTRRRNGRYACIRRCGGDMSSLR